MRIVCYLHTGKVFNGWHRDTKENPGPGWILGGMLRKNKGSSRRYHQRMEGCNQSQGPEEGKDQDQ